MDTATTTPPSSAPLLRTLTPAQVAVARHDPVDDVTLAHAATIVKDVRAGGLDAVRRHAERLGDIQPGQPLIIEPAALHTALGRLPADDRGVLERTAERIRAFATVQRGALRAGTTAVAGGQAGFRVHSLHTAGCYAPGGRFPLPSSVLMTAVTARVAGVKTVWVASPRPADATLAAAAIAGADAVLAVGGAQAVAALAFGAAPVPACDIVVGPGSRWVTAAKQLIAGRVAIDMLAGPSELVVLADESADPAFIAADLLAQAEHDPDALPVLVTTHAPLIAAVNAALATQLVDLPTAATARAALRNGFAVRAATLTDGIALCEQLAPEHLEVLTHDADAVAAKLTRFGGLFIGGFSAEVFGDYGAGPNHVLPTGGAARFTGGLSVFNFLRVNTWLRLEPGTGSAALTADAECLARIEGLEAHARAAGARRRDT
jgi:phosphoribosyl-ATP pyrophosphohydrolase/phosphoribosyl-AMP cyclohydrolase/histidinol dehydrogenase